MEKQRIIEVSEKKRDYTRSISEEKLSALITLFKNGASMDILRSEFLANSQLVVAEGTGDADFSLVLDGINDVLSWEYLDEVFAD